MASFNKVIMLGNLTRDPELRYTPSQTPVIDFGIAMNRRWTGQDGSQREETCFVDCQMFGRRAEVVNKYFKKGSPIFIEGRLTFDTWQGQDGSRRSKHRITIENFEFVGGQKSGGGDRGGYGSRDQAPQAPQAAPNAGEQPPAGDPMDDIPF